MLLFTLALAMLVIQAVQLEPLLPPTYEVVWEEGQQLLPVAVSAAPVTIGEEFADDLPDLLQSRSVLWPRGEGPPAELSQRSSDRGSPEDCELWLRLSRHHWVRRTLSRSELAVLAIAPPLAGGAIEPRHAVRGFVDDDDGDGDPLDTGEVLSRAPTAEGTTEAWLRCGAEP
ncbi:MAG: hypothetical protein AAF604_02115 [Acidobacteriota bacterium]